MMRRVSTIGLLALAACGGADGPPSADVHLRVDTIRSAALGADKRVVVHLPASYATDTARRYPVIYYLHGAGEGEGSWVAHGRLDRAADSLAALGAGEAIVVMPDGDDGYWTDWPDSTRDAERFEDCRREHAWWAHAWREPADRYCVPHPRYERFVVDELLPAVDARYRTLAGRAHRGVAGASMGGYGAIALALAHPGLFSAAASHSGVLAPVGAVRSGPVNDESLAAAYAARWPYWSARFGTRASEWMARDPCQRASALVAPAIPALRLDAGDDDPLAWQTASFHRCLERLRVPHELHGGGGRHDWSWWRAAMPHALEWLQRRIA